MIEDDEQNIVVLRKRRRNNAKGASGHERNPGEAESSGKQWNWTRPENSNPFSERQQREERDRSQRRNEEPQQQKRISYRLPKKEDPTAPPDTLKLPFDPWRLLSAVQRRWYWLVIGTVALGGLAFFAGAKALPYKISVLLIRREVSNAINPNEQDPNRPRAMSEQTLYAFMRSGEVLRRVVARAATNLPPVATSVPRLGKGVNVAPSSNPDILILSLSGSERSAGLATLVNIYAEEVVRYTREIQASESGDVASYLQEKVGLIEKDLGAAMEELARFQKTAGIVNLEKDTERYMNQIAGYEAQYETARIDLEMVERQILGADTAMKRETPKDDKLRVAQEELEALKINYQPAHPLMIAAQKKVELLKKQTAEGGVGPQETPGGAIPGTSFGNMLFLQKIDFEARKAGYEKKIKEFRDLITNAKKKIEGVSDKAQEFGNLKARVQSLEATRLLLANRQRDAQLFNDNAMGYYRVHGQASPSDIDWKRRMMKILAMSAVGAAGGFISALLLAFIAEARDTTLRTVTDIERATQMPALAALGDLRKMSPQEQDEWAFDTLTLLRGKLCATPEGALVCGFISLNHGEGRSTWVELLKSAAIKRGLRVLKMDMRPDGEGVEVPQPPPSAQKTAAGSATKNGAAAAKETAADAAATEAAPETGPKPMDVVKRMDDAGAIVHFPVPGWVWSLDGRKQWHDALAQWRDIDNSVILIDLPPATSREAILLAEKIPQVIWLTGSGMADVKNTRKYLDILRHGNCNLVGAALNRAPAAPLNTRILRWFNLSAWMILLSCGLSAGAQAQETKQTLAFSGASQIKRAAWQERLTLGPGDTMDIALYGHPELTRTNLFVGPDGRLSYLQAQAITAQGMTIEELRARLDEELGKFYTTARTMIVPTGFNSKKYYILGKVNTKGVFPLDRPMTVVEAVARAQGLETGLYERNTVEMADLSRSFLIRKGDRQKLDFEKLFYEGDLTQNLAIEPDDFLFFGAAAVSENYVLGQVMNPGPVGFAQSATVLTAITDRGGFNSRAYKGKVLVVRGSLNKPQTFIVNTTEILDGAKPDFKLESKDIIYVAERPWVRAEELLDEATQSFIQGFVAAFSGVKIGPFIKNPIFGN